MTQIVPSGSTAVMARRVEAPDSLDFFPTPPWATRALVEHVLFRRALIDCVRLPDLVTSPPDPCLGFVRQRLTAPDDVARFA